MGAGRGDTGWWRRLIGVGRCSEGLRDARGSGWWVLGCGAYGVGALGVAGGRGLRWSASPASKEVFFIYLIFVMLMISF